MLITLLGSSAAWPIPRLGCACDQCGEARAHPALARSRTGIRVRGEAGGEFQLDASCDIYGQLEGAGLDLPEDVVISHAHGDHCLGLTEATRHPRRARNLWAHATVLDALGRLFPGALGGRKGYRACPLTPGAEVEVAGVRVTPFDVHHTPGQGFTTLGFLLVEGRRQVFVSTDFKRLDPPDLERVARADLWIMDGSGLETSYPTHAPMAEILALRRDHGGGRVLFTHVGHVRKDRQALADALSVLGSGLEVSVALDGTRVLVEDLRITIEHPA